MAGSSNRQEQNTRWVVITGAPSSGKTSLCMALAAKGFQTAPEVARLCIDSGISDGKSLSDIRKDELAFQWQVLKLKRQMERKLSPCTPIVFDRAIPDSIAYGLSYDSVLPLMGFRYAKVFYMESVGLTQDYARTEDESLGNKIGKKILETYRELGYDVVVIPKKTLSYRLSLVENYLGEPV